jgi:hypothetical protein
MITLYKYRPFNDYLKPVIMSQKIWFPARAGLNDPEDLVLKFVEDVDEEVYHKFLLKKADQESWPRKHLKYNLKKAFTPRGDLTSEAKRKIASSQAVLQKYFDNLGILSLSDKENDPVLWERYGDKEKGVCIVFKMELSEYLLRVEYETPRPQPKLSVLLLSADADQELIKVLRTKTTKWSDESEWRYFVSNSNTQSSFLGKIAAIRIGKKMLDANRKTIAQWVAAAGQPIDIED